MTKINTYWNYFSHLGVQPDGDYHEKRILTLVNRINLLIILLALLGFLSTCLDLLFLSHGRFSLGAFRLGLLGLGSVLTLVANKMHMHYSAKILTCILPGLFLIIFPTVLGDARIEYFFYYPFSATALAILPILLLPGKRELIIRITLIAFHFVLAISIDLFLVEFSGNFNGLFGDRYLFYKVSILLLFFFVVPVVSVLRSHNANYEALLEEKSRILEEQKAILSNQSDELQATNEELTATNEELASLTEELSLRNKELQQYHTNLEQIIESERARVTANESRYKLLFENANDAIFIMQGEKFIDCNLKTLRIFGCTREQIVGKNPTDFSPPFQPDGSDSLVSARNYIGEAMKNKPQRFEWKHMRQDKSLFDAEVSLNALEINGEPFIQAIVRDITDKKQAEIAIRESEQKIRAVFDMSYQFVGLLSPEGNLLEANRTALEFVGTTFEQIAGKPFWETPWWTHSAEAVNLIRQAILHASQGEIVKFETTHMSRMGEEHEFIFELKPVFNNEGKIIFLVPEGFDITDRNKADRALRKSEERLQKLLSSVTDYIYSVQIENGRVIDTVHGVGCLTVTGYDPLEFRNNEFLWYEIVYNEDKEKVKEHTSKLSSGLPVHWIEHRIIHKNGTIRWVRNTPVVQFDNSGDVMGYDGLISDITERKQAEMAVAESEEQYRKLVESIPDMIMLSDPQGNIIYGNEHLERITGITPKDYRNPDRTAHIHPEDRPAVLEAMMELITGNKVRTAPIVNRFIDSWGNLHWFSGTVTRLSINNQLVFQTVTRDITEQRQTEEAIRISEEKFSKSFNESPVPMLISSLESKKLLDVNEAFIQLAGYAREEAVGKTIVELDLWNSPEDMRKIIQFALGDATTFREEISYLNRKRETVICNTALMKINISGENCIIGIFEDITDRKLMQQKLLDTILETEEKERRKFAADLHDEIGPQLATINIYASSLRKRTNDPEQLAILNELVDINKKTITAVRELSNNMSPHILEMYGLSAAVKSETELKKAFFQIELKQNIEQLRLDRNTEIIVYRIIKELLNNTLKHALASRVTIGLNFIHGTLNLDYADNGKGFDFDPSLKMNSSGLGLMNIRSRINSTGGSLSIITSPGKGFILNAKIPATLKMGK